MPRFRAEVAFEETPDEKIPPIEVKLPLDRNAFSSACLDIEEELFLKHDERLVEITTITAIEEINAPSIKPGCSPIQKGDVVWRSWLDFDFLNPDSPPDKKEMQKLLDDYKPLWEAGPGYNILVDVLIDDTDIYI